MGILGLLDMKNNTIKKQSAATVKINRHSLLFKVTFVALILGTISMFLSSFLLYTIFRSRAENNLSENMSKTLIACGTQLLQYQSLDWLFSYWQEHYDQMNLPPFETTEIFRKWNLDHDEFYHLNTSSITTEDILNMPEEKQLLFAEYAYLYTFFALSKIRASNDLNDLMIFLPHNSGETAFVFFQSTSDDKPLSDMHMALGKEISSPVKDHSKYLELFENKGSTPSKLEITTYEDVAYATMYTNFSDTLPVFSVSMSMKEMLDDVWADVWAFEKWLAPLFICLLIIFLYILYRISLKPTMELAYHIRSYTSDKPSDHLIKNLENLSKRGDELGSLSGDIIEMILRNEQYFQQQFENETLKSKILLVQIKPHFIYNSLSVIRSMLDDPEKA